MATAIKKSVIIKNVMNDGYNGQKNQNASGYNQYSFHWAEKITLFKEEKFTLIY